MVKIFFSVFIVGVLLGGGIAQESLCLVEILSQLYPSLSLCENLKAEFDRVRTEIEKCTTEKISLNKLEAFYEDFCFDEDFRAKISSNQQCFSENSIYEASCYGQMPKEGNLKKGMCGSIVRDITNCLIEKVGKPCGDGVEVYRRMREAQEPMLTGICIQTAGAEANSAFLWLMLMGLVVAVKWFL